MSVNVDADGRRWVRVEVETPGTVEEVWRAIATASGISSWFVPAELDIGADGQPCARLDLPGEASKESPAWETLAAGLGIAGAEEGERRCAPDGALRFAGLVDRVPDESEIIMRLDEPACGAGHLLAMAAQDQFIISVRLYLYGDGAAEVVERYLPRWRAWMQERFPVRAS